MSTPARTLRRPRLSAARPSISYKATIAILGSILLPPLLLLEAWKTSNERYRHWVLTFFFTIYGATITIAFDPLGVGPDGVRHLLSVYTHYIGLGFDEYLIQLWQILTFQLTDSPKEDVYIHSVSYLVGGVLGAPWLFWPIIATVYGYFFTGSMLIIFRDWGRAKMPVITLFLIATFFLFKNIEGVNTVRTWTGLWVLVYACLQYYQTRKFRYLVLMAMPPFIHFGYFIMALPAYAVLLFGTRTLLYSVLFAASSFTTFINPGQMTEVIATTELGEQRVQAYYRDSTAAAGQVFEQSTQMGNRIWLTLEKAGVQKWALLVFVYTLLIAGVYHLRMDDFQKRIFSIGLLMITLSNSTWYLFAVSNRSWIIGAVFLFAAFVMWRLGLSQTGQRVRHNQLYKIGLHVSAVLFIPYFLYNLSVILDYPSVYLIAFPFIPWLDPSLNMSIKEFLQILLIEMLRIL